MNENHRFRNLNMGLPDDILRYKIFGDYEEAMRAIDFRISKGDLNQELEDSLLVQREIMRRLPNEYPFSKEEALGLLQKHISDFTLEEFKEYVLKGKIDWIYVRGEPHYFARFFESLMKTDSDFASRVKTDDYPSTGIDRMSNSQSAFSDVRKEMLAKGNSAKRIRIHASLQLKDEFYRRGQKVRVHLPIPAACDQQSDIRIEKIYPPNAFIAPEDADQRTICWEETIEDNHEFKVEYSYIHNARYTNIEQIRPDLNQGKHETGEKPPHIMFTPYILKLGDEITRGLECPLKKAKAIYDFITRNVSYGFMPSYFCMESIAETCAINRKGDCGVMTLLFMTLCRSQGIPARWQSGLIAREGFCSAHDWAEFYIRPHGWLYADTSFGRDAAVKGDEEKREFYFGNLDPFRMVANNAFQADFVPEKKYWRCDPYDNQVGEIESDEGPFTYSMFERFKEVVSIRDVE